MTEFSIQLLEQEIQKQNLQVSRNTLWNIINFFNIKPSRIEALPNGRQRYFYSRECLVKLAWEIRRRISIRSSRISRHSSCHWCRQSFEPSSLISGLCPSCHAYKYIENYCHNGNKIANIFDKRRAKLLLRAILALLKKNR